MAAPPSNHCDSVHLTVSKTCRVEEEAKAVGHTEATSSAAHPGSFKNDVASSSSSLRLPSLPLFMLSPFLITSRSPGSPGSFKKVILLIF